MVLLFYRWFLWLYKTGAAFISPWNVKARQWTKGRRQLLEKIQREISVGTHAATPSKQVAWMHCASLGEFEQGRPLLEGIRSLYPGTTIVLTFFSPSGYQQVVANHKAFADYVWYLPLDGAANASKLLDLIRPTLVLWVKYEYWHYYLAEIKRRQVPLLLISGVFRPDQPFFKWYGGFHKNLLRTFTHLFVQNEGSAQLLQSIGFSENVTVAGDTRFDRVTEIAARFTPDEEIMAFILVAGSQNEAQVIVAGSTWEEDEEELVHFVKNHPEIKFIIAPHDVQESRLQEVEKLFKSSMRFSRWKINRPSVSPRVLIIDNIGMLSQLYHYATIAYIGGGFGDDGVHNVLEAAVYYKPVVFGPVYEKYGEAVDLVNQRGGFAVESALQLELVFNRLLNDEAAYARACESAGSYVSSKKNATISIANYIQEKRLLTR